MFHIGGKRYLKHKKRYHFIIVASGSAIFKILYKYFLALFGLKILVFKHQTQ